MLDYRSIIIVITTTATPITSSARPIIITTTIITPTLAITQHHCVTCIPLWLRLLLPLSLPLGDAPFRPAQPAHTHRDPSHPTTSTQTHQTTHTCTSHGPWCNPLRDALQQAHLPAPAP